VARVSIFLIVVVLIVGMVGCDVDRESYTLTITSTPGGSVVEPGEGMFTYYAGTEVDLVAEADEGYRFLNWSGVLIHIANRKAAATTIVMDKDYSISANFAVPTLVWDWYGLNATRDDLYGIYILMNDLNSTTPGYEELAGPTANGGKGWQPIGSTNETQFDVFHGTLDGGGYEICDLFINRPNTYDVGLLSVIWLGGGITNLGVVNATVTGYMWVGGLAAGSIGVVDNSYSVASVNGTAHVGGLVGASGVEGIVSNSYFIGNVTGDWSVGGLLGGAGSIVSDCHSTGHVTGDERVGGLVGANAGTVSDCHSTGHVTGNERVGGLVGENMYSSGTVNTVSNSYSTGSVTGGGNAGGLVGENWGTVSNSYSTGSVTGGFGIGGLAGVNYLGTITNSYSTGGVTGQTWVGGLVGSNSEGTVNKCYSTGNVTGNEDVGGLVGYNRCIDESCGIVINSSWDTETSGQATSAGGTGKTTMEMQDINTFSGAGWDIIRVVGPGTRNLAYIWNIVDDETYPFLSWQP
jgi:hypothetical protein